MKLKFLFLCGAVCLSVSSFAQNVGIGTASPGTKLDVNGAVTYRETAVAISGNAATIPSNVSQVRLTGTATATITLTAPTAPPNAGQQLVIYNNTTGGYGATYGGATIPDGVAIAFIYSNSTWVASSDASSGSSSYIDNQTTQQASSNFNISGTGEIGTTAIIGTGEASAGPAGGTLRAPNAGSGNTTGASLTVAGGYAWGNAPGGNAYIYGGATGAAAYTNGSVYLRGGYNTGTTATSEGSVYINDDHTGSTYINTGGGNTTVGGLAILGTGDASGAPAGNILRAPNAGSGNTAGGNIQLNGGFGWGSGAGGSAYVQGGSAGGSGGTNGNTYIRGGYGNSAEGAVYINDGGSGTGTVTAYFGNTYINQNSSGTGGGAVFLGGLSALSAGSGTMLKLLSTGQLALATAASDYQAPIANGTGLYYSPANTLNSYWTYTGTGSILTNNNTGNLVIATTEVVGTGDATGAPGTGTLRGPNAGSGNASGGGLNISAGYAYGSGTGGNVTVTGGTTGTGTNGNTILRGGYSNSAEGYVLINDDHTGRVGVGTATPQTQMEVSAGTTDLLKLTSTTGGAGNHAYIDFSTFATATNNYLDARIGAIDMNNNNGGLVFETGNNGSASSTTIERMRILNTGYIGMGITVPNSNLHVLASSGQGIVIDAPSGSQGLMFYTGGSSTASGTQKGALALAGAAGAWSTDAATNDMVLRSSSGNKVLINTNAGTGASTLAVNGSYVGVGTTAPAVKLHVIASSNTDGILIQNTAGGGGAQANLYFETYAGESIAGADIAGIDDGSYSAHLTFSTRVPGSSGNALTERMRLSSGGYLGIGTTTPGYPLDVEIATSGSAIGGSSYGYLNNGGAGHGSSTTGNVGIYCSQRILAGSEVDANSDRRIKKNICYPTPSDMLAVANNLHVATYNYIDQFTNGMKLKTGFIAQEVQEALPGAVNMDPGFIPSIYAAAQSVRLDGTVLRVTTSSDHGLAAGDEIKLFDKSNKEYRVNVAQVEDAKNFTVQNWNGPIDNLFVYGKKVTDLRNVDFSQIASVAIGAVQELSKKDKEQQAEIEKLKAENAALKAGKVDRADYDRLKASVETLEQIIGSKAQK